MTIKKILGKRIRELRIKNNMTQAQLAELVGIEPKYQSCIENGRNFPSADLLDKYTNIFDITMPVLLDVAHNEPRVLLENKLKNLIDSSSDDEFIMIYRIINSVLR